MLTVEDEQGQTDSETLFVSVLPPLPSVSTYGEGVDELAVELDSLNSAILRMIEAATDGYSSSEISIDESNAGRVFAAIQHAQAYNARFLLIESQVDSLAEASGSAGAQSAMLSTGNAPSDDEGIGFKVLNEMTSGVAKFFSSVFSLQSGRVEDFAPMVLETLRNPSAYPDSYEALGDRPDPVTSVADWQALSTNEKRWKVERLRGTLFCVEWQSACRENDQKFAEDLDKTAVEGGKMSVELGTSAAGLDDPKLDVVKEVTRVQGSNVPETVIEAAYETAQASFGTVKQNVTETVDKLFERTQPDSDSPTVDASNAKQYLRRFIRQANQVEHNTLGQVIDVQLNDALDRFPELGFRDADGNVVMHVPEKSHIGESTRSGTYKTFADKVQIGAVTDQVVAYFNEVRNPDTDASYPLNPGAADATADVQTGATTSTNPYSSEPTYVRGEISTSTWSKYGSPYVIDRRLTVKEGATLTIEPSVVVKFRRNAAGEDAQLKISEGSTFSAEGTEEKPIVFTSIRDDTAGGDTNGDGDQTQPASGDWKQVLFEDAASSAIDHAIIRYGGARKVSDGSLRSRPMINIRGSSPTITNSRISRSYGAGVRSKYGYARDYEAAEPLIEGNEFVDNAGEGVTVETAGGTIRENTFTDNAIAIRVHAGNGFGYSNPPVISGNSVVNNNLGIRLSGESTPSLGTASDYGRNVFRNNDDFAVRNNSDETVQAVGNYWNATTASAIEERLSGPVAFEPFLDEEPPDPQTIAVEAGETGTFDLGDTGGAVAVTENTGEDDGQLRFARYDRRPPANTYGGSATAPDGSTVAPDTTAGRYWTISAEGLSGVTYRARLEADGIDGLGDAGQLVLLKREGSEDAWTPLETSLDEGVLVSEALTSFSQFTVGAQLGEDAPALTAHAKVYLEGPYDAGSSGAPMRTGLGESGQLPAAPPYDAAAYEGTPLAYDGGTSVASMPEAAVDWVLVELRTEAAASTAVATQAALLMSDGTLAAPDGSGGVPFAEVSAGDYYVVVRHRNHLPVMSAEAVALPNEAGASYDFTSGPGQAYGDGATVALGSGSGDGEAPYALWSGNYRLDGEGQVTSADFTPVQNGLSEGASGYRLMDGTLDGEVTSADFTPLQNALSAGAASRVPESSDESTPAAAATAKAAGTSSAASETKSGANEAEADKQTDSSSDENAFSVPLSEKEQ